MHQREFDERMAFEESLRWSQARRNLPRRTWLDRLCLALLGACVPLGALAFLYLLKFTVEANW